MLAYHASHEQFSPKDLLKYADLAAKNGFHAIHSSDHFQPWIREQGHSGYSFAWLGAAMQATNLPFGLVCTPGERYHPAIVAQAIATLCNMFDSRFWVAFGSGEAINEHITGNKWPNKVERNEKLLISVKLIRDLLAGKEAHYEGLVRVHKSKLHTLPDTMPLLLGAAVTEQTAEWMGSWADGLLTVNKPQKELKKVVEAFHRGGGQGKPLFLKAQLSYHPDADLALEEAHTQWKANVLDSNLLSDLPSIEHFEQAATYVRKEDVAEKVRVSSNLEQHIEWIKQDMALGFTNIILHNVNKNQIQFIEDFGKHVMPNFPS